MLLLSILIYFIDDGPEIVALIAGLIVALFVSLGMQLLSMQNLQLQYRTPESCLANENVPLRLEIRRRFPLPMGMIRLHVRIRNVLYNIETEDVVEIQPGEHQEQEQDYRIRSEKAGNVTITIYALEYYDILGIFKWSRKTHVENNVLVYPPQVMIRTRVSSQPEMEIEGELYDSFRKGQDPREVVGLRDYMPGDSLKSIHWKLSGKKDDILVKEAGFPSNDDTLIFCDMMKHANGEEIPDAINDVILSLAFTISHQLLEENREHQVMRMQEQGELRIPVYSENDHQIMTTQFLCSSIPEKENSDGTLAGLLHSQQVGRYGKAVLITPRISEEVVSRLSKRMNLTVVYVTKDTNLVYSEEAGYSIIPVDAETCQRELRNIIL